MCRSQDEVERLPGAAAAPGAKAPCDAPQPAGEFCCSSGRDRTWSEETSASGSSLSPHSSVASLSRQTTSEQLKHDTCIIFDWDDTLLCTSFLNLSNGELGEIEARHLRSIESAVARLLEASQRAGRTFIVTNSVSGWVQYSAAEYIPAVVPLLENVPIISARDRFEAKFPEEGNRWKTEAFLDIERELDAQVTCDVISLGDNSMEMDAAHVLGGALDAAAGRHSGPGSASSGVRVKTVKFRERPTPEELLKQLELVLQKFEKIVESPKGLKISLERKWVGNAREASS